jgi:crotonobetainyl-CoA:carnitine CoA-transferase CaiB-like acyl-CoA transferase
MTAESAQAPLGGILVLDFTHLVAGPFCTMLLADAGADVVKIEPPWGDHSRNRGPTRQEGEVSVSSYLAAGNRGKRSLALNLKTEGGHAAAQELLERADIVIENFAPGVISRMGYDFDELRARRPEVITASISLFGGRAVEGRLAGRSGLAIVAESESGLANLCRDSLGTPIPFGFVLGDIASGLAAYGAIVTALLHRQATGIGRHVDIAMVHTLMAFNGIAIAGQSLGDDSDRPLPTSPYGYFVARDGFVAIAVNVDPLWVKFTAAIGRPELASDPRYADHVDRDPRREEVTAIVEAWTRRRTCDEVVSTLSPLGVPCGRLTTPAELLASPDLRRLGFLKAIADGMGGSVDVVSNPLGYDAGYPAIPGVGEQTAEILRSTLGLSSAQIAAMLADGQAGADPAALGEGA